MTPWYSLMESPSRWWYIAGISFLAGSVGAMAMLGYGWNHTLARVWFYVLAAVTVGALVQGVREWLNPVTRPPHPAPPARQKERSPRR